MAGTTVMIRNLGKAVKARLVAFARERALCVGAAAAALIERGLDNVDSGAAGGRARAENLTAAERSAQATHAANARWGKP